MSSFNSLESWLKTSGAKGLEEVSLSDFPLLGRGLKALQPFKKDERILTIPHDLLWTVEKANSDPLLGPVLRDLQPRLSVDDTLAVYILFVKSRTSGYEGQRSHVQSLPTSYSSSIFFSEEELEPCAGSSLYTVTMQLKRQIEDDFKDLVMRLFGTHGELFPLEKFTIEDYKWALCTVWSRAMDFQLADGTSLRLIAPFVDMLNHSSEVGQCHVYDSTSGDLSVLAGKDYQVGDQIFIYYGSIPNNRLLRLYGFVIPGNPHDSYDLVLSTHPSAPFFEQKANLWKLAGLDLVPTISLTLADPLPKKVLRYLRIQRLDESNLATVLLNDDEKNVANEKVSDENEIEILTFLVQSIQYILENFGTKLEKLEQQLDSDVYSPGSNIWAAAQVSIGEQKILRLARDKAKSLLVAVQSSGAAGKKEQCANCGKSAKDLKMCARCKAVKYCGRECQVAHFQKHKTACRELQARNT